MTFQAEKSAENYIFKIRFSEGILITDLVSITKHFNDYYSLLYKSEPPMDRSLMESFFEPLSIASIMYAMREELELPFSAEEIIESMQNDKTSGPDRFPVEFFKRFSQTLKAPLLDMLLDSLIMAACLQPSFRLVFLCF